MKNGLIQLVYLSSTRWLLTAVDIASILEASLRNNVRNNITGILLYRSGSVMQMLEGNPELVHRVFEVIKRDNRHHRITLVYDIPITKRDFPGWSMAYRDLEVPPSPGQIGYSPLLEEQFDIRDIGPARAREVLSMFRDHFR